MTNEVTALRESIATLESQLEQAEGRAIILQAQLGSWEAACAAQVEAARAYLTTLRHVGHSDAQLRARQELEHSIDSNAGETLLARLERQRITLEWYADVTNYDHAGAPGTLDLQVGEWHIDGGERARATMRSLTPHPARPAHADELADAVEHFQEMSRAAEIDPSRKIDLAAASYRLGTALAAYRAAQKART